MECDKQRLSHSHTAASRHISDLFSWKKRKIGRKEDSSQRPFRASKIFCLGHLVTLSVSPESSMLDLNSGDLSNLFTAPNVDAARVLVSLVALSVGTFLSLTVRGASQIPKTYFPPSSVQIITRTEKGVEEISLRKFVEQKCPSLRSPFVPAWWLFR